MKIRSKSFALLLSLAMFFAYMPAFAFADDTPSGGSSESGAAVAQIGDVKYATLKEAAAAASGKSVTIELLADTALDETTHTATEGYEIRFPADVDSVTINGNGHSITLAGAPEGYSWPNEAGVRLPDSPLQASALTILRLPESPSHSTKYTLSTKKTRLK